MTFLRWSLFAIAALTGMGFAGLMVVGGGFRRSFGASDTHPLLAIIPVLVFALILASLLLPGSRALLHVTAAVNVLVILGSAWILRESAFLGTAGISYASAWFLYYRLAA